ncbi:MAG: sulfatase-like hydrolase/transferase, partial [Planctomycetota bacterium]
MNRVQQPISWLTAFAMLCTMMAATARAGSVNMESKPNIVWIVGDDHGWRDSEPYGDRQVNTPGMTRLAREGMRFTHAFAASRSG